MGGSETGGSRDPGGTGLAGRVALLVADERWVAAISRVVAQLGGAPPLLLRCDRDVLATLLGGRELLAHVLVEPGASVDGSLVDALGEASPEVMTSPLPPLPPDPAEGERLIRALLTRPASAAERVPPLGPEEGGLRLHYQPIVRVRDRRLVMLEALARWRQEPVTLGPGSFVPAMEQAGLARRLAGAVARIAARDLMRDPRRGAATVSINLPVEELEKRDTLWWIARQLRASRLPRRRLAIELTETSPVHDYARLGRSVHRLRAAGHEVLIDDFQLDDRRRRLLRLPFSGVKLDKELVQRLSRSARARQQVRRLARSGLVVTAEGVSEEAIWRCLRTLGVARAQGFWVARPMPIAALSAWQSRWRAGPLPRPGQAA